MELPPERVPALLTISQQPVSLQAPVGEEDGSSLGDSLVDEAAETPVEAVTGELRREQLA